MKVIKLKDNNLSEVIAQAKSILKTDGLVVLPSDTAYGLAANACSARAVQKVYDFKGRQFAKGLSIFLSNLDEVGKYAQYDQEQEAVLKTLLPGPFTVILESRGKVTPSIEPGDGTLGVRVIEHNLVKALTRSVPFPITATSANISGRGPHFSVKAFLATLSQRKKAILDLVIDAGPLPRRPTSTLVRLAGDKIEILREGTLSLKQLLKYETKAVAETKQLAQKIYLKYLEKELKNKAVVVILKGDLGAGKTVFAKGIGELFDLELTSPTFVLMGEHHIKGRRKGEKGKGSGVLDTLYHLDLFRIESEEEILELKIEQFLGKGNLMLIEWGEKLSVFEKLKNKKTVFYLLQIEELSEKRRKFNFFQL